MAVANMENFQEYTTAQFELVGHALVIGYAAQAAGFIYFYSTMGMTSKKHKLSSVYGMIVMASAFILLYNQWKAWEESFVYNLATETYHTTGTKMFSNGYRYLNWSIDVPLLLLQLVLVSGIETGEGFMDVNLHVSVSGLLMIYCGYIGQFYEDNDKPALLVVMGVVGCIFYIIMLALVMRCLNAAKQNLPEKTHFKVNLIGAIFAIFWTIYPISYFMPVISYSANGVVIRQFIYTIADVVSKVIYGVILTQITMQVGDADDGDDDEEMAKRYMQTDDDDEDSAVPA